MDDNELDAFLTRSRVNRRHSRGNEPDVLLAALLARTTTDPETGCWLWGGGTDDKGYGRIGVDGASRLVHRIGYSLLGREPLDDELVIDHLCRVRNCWNPVHLEQCSQRENVQRSIPYLRAAKTGTHCKRGHEYTFENVHLYTNPAGTVERHCRECMRLRKQKRKQASIRKLAASAICLLQHDTNQRSAR